MYWREIADECKANKFTKALIVEDIVANGTIADAYQLSAELPQMGYLGIKVAFVDKYLEQQELNLFGELTAINRGINAKVFNDINEAEKWLLGGYANPNSPASTARTELFR